jgi:hypothetical protein
MEKDKRGLSLSLVMEKSVNYYTFVAKAYASQHMLSVSVSYVMSATNLRSRSRMACFRIAKEGRAVK